MGSAARLPATTLLPVGTSACSACPAQAEVAEGSSRGARLEALQRKAALVAEVEALRQRMQQSQLAK